MGVFLLVLGFVCDGTDFLGFSGGLTTQTLKRLKRLLVENQPSNFQNKKKEGKRMSERYRKYGRAKNCRCKNCGLEFKTEGNARNCPRCHSVIEV
jgi:predicted Zn-ribbon and HTH transcriptional regulator